MGEKIGTAGICFVGFFKYNLRFLFIFFNSVNVTLVKTLAIH